MIHTKIISFTRIFSVPMTYINITVNLLAGGHMLGGWAIVYCNASEETDPRSTFKYSEYELYYLRNII